jgi:hypothetical protein
MGSVFLFLGLAVAIPEWRYRYQAGCMLLAASLAAYMLGAT